LFSLASYNVLATAYIRRAYYPRTPALILEPAWRIPVVVQRVSALDNDIICLQEVEREVLAPLRLGLGAKGYSCDFTPRGGGRPDGCATFYRSSRFELNHKRPVSCESRDSDNRGGGQIGMVTTFTDGDRSLGVINVHLTWDRPETPAPQRAGLSQAARLVEVYESVRSTADAWIVAGDLNVTPDSDLVEMLADAGFSYAHRFVDCHTCKVGAEAKTIDYVLYSPPLAAEPEASSTIGAGTVLPSADEPSDHVPIAARFMWRS
jgi:mRNA deadenylase 3'-5' endonuclease subunit Ccr4